MELLTLAASILLIALTILLLRRSPGDATLPPGSFGWPILGESIEFLFGKPEKFVGDRMRKYSPDIFKTKILGEKTAVICGPAGHKFLFSNEQKLFTVFRPHPMQHLFRSYKPKSESSPAPPSKATDETKAIRQPGFLKPEALMRYLAGMDLITQKQLHVHCDGKKVVEFYPLSKTITLTIACQFFLGINNPERIARLVKNFDDVTIADKMMGLLTAGYSTVATTMTFLMKYLGLNPDMYERVRAEQLAIAAAKKEGVPLDWEDMAKMKYSWNVISETMRMVPPLQGTFREVIEEFTYAGYTIPKGWKVYWTVSTTNMNPQYFKDPERFNPSRYDEGEAPPPYTYVPFGGGMRMCPGKEYARISILAFVHNVVKKYRWEVVDPNEKVEGDMMPAPQKGLPVRLYQH
ncbi:hypothetical protein SASPL_154062 [Salvia splendens]|uniref:Uncharacterized protein n=1 Tax=Salvia splendens TaxID=180675 RepID=A0A8X8YZI3_SALSN|nr:hypothetical protein SASPL_154062 [Salvia splendens]